MSFILDALRKSETDRQQKAAPGIADVPMAKPGGRAPRWLPILIGLLAVNLAAVLYLLVKPDPELSVAAETGPGQDHDAGVGESVSLARITPQADPAPAVPTTGMPAPGPATESREPAMTPAADAVPAIDSGEASAATPRPGEPVSTPASGAATGSAAEDETWLTLNDLRASGNVDLPEMHIDLHVYSDKPGERFVFINMNQYREKATLAEGPRLRRITPEGVILDYRGSTFLLPRE